MNTISHIDILALQSVKGCGPAMIERIHRNLKGSSGQDVFDTIRELRLKPFADMDSEYFCGLEQKAEHILENSEDMGIKAVSIFDSTYPSRLRATTDENGKLCPPILLFYKGDLSIAELPSIAIIGTREPSPEGVKAGLFFGEKFANLGLNIVSGLAIGCDSTGHKGALKANGKTTAFLAHGLDTVFPAENEGLAEDIVANGGLLMSEYAIGTPVSAYRLVARDRLQASLGDATIVIQTGIKGGTMHAANATLEAGKPLYVVNYNDDVSWRFRDKVQGNLYLQSRGAMFISSQTDLQALADSLFSGRDSVDEEILILR